jgi:hypothetical protein
MEEIIVKESIIRYCREFGNYSVPNIRYQKLFATARIAEKEF